MMQTSPDSVWEEFVSQFRTFLRPDLSPDAAAASLAALVRPRMPLDVLVAVRTDAKGRCLDHGFWAEGNPPLAAAIRAHLVAAGKAPLLRTSDGTSGALPEAATITAALPEEARSALHWTIEAVPGPVASAGFILAGKPRSAASRTDTEKAVLHCAASLLGLFFQGMEHGAADSRMLGAIMDQAGMGIYVTNPHTDVILYMNRTMKELFRIPNPEGKVCWKVLQVGRDKRCEYCPVPLLLQRDGNPFVYRWEERNTLTEKVFEKYDSLIPWVNGAVVHLQQSMDITGSRRLYRTESGDGLPDRLGGLAALSHSLDEARTGGQGLVVCMLEPLYPAQGDGETDRGRSDERTLRIIAEVLLACLEAPDFAFRYGPDVFAAVFHGVGRYDAALRLNDLISRMERTGRATDDVCAFPAVCGGLFEVPAGHDLAPAEVLTNTDQNLYEQKRLFRIRESEHRLEEGTAADSVKPFSFDASHLFSALTSGTDVHMFACDITTGVFRWSRNMVEEFDLPGESVKNGVAVWGTRIHPDDRQSFLEACRTLMDGRTAGLCLEYRVRNRRGDWVRIRHRGGLERDASGTPRLFAGFIRNLDQRDKIDRVTGLYNKVKLEEDLTALREADPGRVLTLMVLGVDGFKQVNDLHDRLFGDEILRRIGQKISEMLPEHTGVYRLDSDEFGILIRGGRLDAQRLYRSLSAGFRFQQEFAGKKYFCTLSAGSASCPEDAETCTDLLQCADSALRRSKTGGRDRLTVFNRTFIEERRRSLEMTELLRESMERNYAGFSLVYQPQVDVGGRVTGAEALTRWTCDKHGPVSPAEFVPLLEQSGLIIPFGKWLFRKAAEQCRDWVRRRPDFVLSVNLSYLQVASDDMIPFIRNTLNTLGLAPANLTLEFTESCMIGENARIHAVFDELRRIGLRIAMDDFGTGYSSLGMLKDSPADVVKIDRVFVRDILHSRFDATFIRFVVALCHDVGIRVCLEGVERAEELELVRPMHLDYIQGYLFGRPVDPDTFEKEFLTAAPGA